MSPDSLDWSNLVAIWWCFLIAVSAINIVLWLRLRSFSKAGEPLLLLSAVYVFGCAFRAVLPRADVQRICLFDTWLSSVLVGRSVATLAELCFAMQWAIVVYELGRATHSDTAKNISRLIMPLIALAECCSWYAVISTNYLGNVLENSLWAATYLLIAIALMRLVASLRGAAKLIVAALAGGVAAYVVFMATIDVPMYFARWQAELASGTPSLGFFAGLHDLATRWVVTRDFADWQEEIPWITLYFSVAVWTSIGLGGFALVKHLVPRYRVRRPLLKPTRRPIPIPVRSSDGFVSPRRLGR
jgi:hypothetical protein